jgi:predicted anti-sigma-YlaC factor YlaD
VGTSVGRAGNQIAASRDLWGMDCAAAREALSALLDDERLGVEREVLDAHLASCPRCRSWREDAHEVTRRFRLAPARTVASPGDELLASGARARAGGMPRRITLTRAALVAVALAQLVWVTVPALVLGSDHDAPIHVSHEMGSFDMAFAVGFLVAAVRPARAQGMRALVGAAALLLILTALIDLAAGRTGVSDEAPHLLALVGWLLLRELATLMPAGTDHPAISSRLLVRWRARRGWRTPVPVRVEGEEPLRSPAYDELAATSSPDAAAGVERSNLKRAVGE